MAAETSVVAKAGLQVVLEWLQQVKSPYASWVDVVGLEWLHVLLYELWRVGFH